MLEEELALLKVLKTVVELVQPSEFELETESEHMWEMRMAYELDSMLGNMLADALVDA